MTSVFYTHQSATALTIERELFYSREESCGSSSRNSSDTENSDKVLVFELMPTPSARTFKSVAHQWKKMKGKNKTGIAYVCSPSYREYLQQLLLENKNAS